MPGNIDLTQGIVLNEAADGGGQGGVQWGKPVLPEQLGSLLQTQVLDVV